MFASAGAVRDPFLPAFSNAQKKSVSLRCLARFTGMLPAKLRGSAGSVPVMLGSFSVTSKSAKIDSAAFQLMLFPADETRVGD